MRTIINVSSIKNTMFLNVAMISFRIDFSKFMKVTQSRKLG